MVEMTSPEREEKVYLELSKNPIRFEPVSKVTNVFFDDANLQVFAVRSGGATGVVAKGPDERTSASFRMEDKGNVISIKFSPDQRVLAVQRSQTSVEFVNFNGELDTIEYSQNCKSQTYKTLGFIWTSTVQIAFITNHGVELYHVVPERRTLKLLKTQSITWPTYRSGVTQPTDSLLLLSSGSQGNQMQPIQFKQSNMYKLPKFEVDLPSIHRPKRLGLLERDVTLANIYGESRVIILRHQPRSLGVAAAEVVIYTFQKDAPAQKTGILKLDMSGRFAVNIVDNLIVIHHQTSKTSMVFDIKLPGESDGYVTYHPPVANPLPIGTFKLKVPVVPTKVLHESAEVTYSPNWVVFQPNIVIDAKLGCLWNLNLCLEAFIEMIPDKCRLLEFLLNRSNSKKFMLQVCRGMLQSPNQSLPELSKIFDKLNAVYRKHLDAELQTQLGMPVNSPIPQRSVDFFTKVVIDQSDMYTHVFTALVDDSNLTPKASVAIVMEYIRSLNQLDIPVQHYLHELVINALVQQGAFYQLHLLLQYHVLSDTKPLACLLLSLESIYPPAYQLALDMLKRLDFANEEIIEVFLSKQSIISALRFVRSIGIADTVSARKFLDAAMHTKDPMVFYSVYRFFEQRNTRLRGSPWFRKEEQCESYVNYFERQFGQTFITPNDIAVQ